MARIRTIKPEFWSDEKLAVLSPMDRLVFLGLIGMSDDFGRVHDNIKVIDAFVFPETEHSSKESLQNLSESGRIIRGQADCGKRVIQIVNWDRHQKVDKPQYKSALPPISEKPAKNAGNELFATHSRIIRDSFANHSEQNDESFATHSRPDLRPTTNDQVPTTNDQVPTTNDQILSGSTGRKKEKTYPDEFENFWMAFPKRRRTKKRDAFKRWQSAVKSIDSDLLIRKALEYARSERGRGEFAVMPSVWLNSGMWEDEPDAWRDSATSSPVYDPDTDGEWNPETGVSR